jgi:hypothetical protein
MIRDVLQRSALTAAASFVFACCAAPPGLADQITLSPRVIQVGKWAEGIAFDGTSMWIAESGQQSIAQIDLNRGTIIRRVTVGRLPVGMKTFTDGAVYALVQTDKRLWQQFPQQRAGKALPALNGCPVDLAAGDAALWVLLEPDCSDANSFVVRVDPRTGARTTSGPLGDKANAIAASPGKLWVSYARGANLGIVDQQSLTIQQASIPGALLFAVAANGANMYAGGEFGNQGVVAAIDPRSGQELQRQPVDERINRVVADNANVVAFGNRGKIFVFSAPSLRPQRTITLTAQPFSAEAALIVGDTLYISNQQQFGENGALLVVNGWRPPVQVPVGPAPALGSAPGPAPIVVANCPYQVVNTADATWIWMYQDPDTSAPQVQAIPAASRGLVVDRCLAGWCHASFRDKSGWIESTHLQPTCN